MEDATLWERRFAASTRGQLLALLRRANRTVEELADTLNVSENAVRVHLTALERDGLVRQRGARRGAGKPAQAFGLTPQAERLFPKAYEALLNRLLAQLKEQLPPEAIVALLAATGERLAPPEGVPDGDLRARLAAAAQVLNRLGGQMEVEEQANGFTLCGYSCPFAAAVVEHPEICQGIQALLTTLVHAPVREQCERGEDLWCWFEITDPARAA